MLLPLPQRGGVSVRLSEKQCMVFIPPANLYSLLDNTLTANEKARHAVSQATVAPPPYFQVPWTCLFISWPAIIPLTVSPGALTEARGGTVMATIWKTLPLPLSTFILFRALVLHTSTGRQRGV